MALWGTGRAVRRPPDRGAEFGRFGRYCALVEERTTWRAALAQQMRDAHDPGPVLAVAPSEDALDVEFDAGYGGTEGPPLLAWTDRRVYFPVCYDGAEWLGSAPRWPRPEGQRHVGGG